MGLFYSFKTLQLSICDLNAAKMLLLELKGLREGSCVGLFYCFKTLLLSICDFFEDVSLGAQRTRESSCVGLFYCFTTLCTVCITGSQPTPVLRKCCDPGHILNEWYECEAVDERQDIFLEEVSVQDKEDAPYFSKCRRR